MAWYSNAVAVIAGEGGQDSVPLARTGGGGATAPLAGMDGGVAQGVGHDSVPLARIEGLQHPWMG